MPILSLSPVVLLRQIADQDEESAKVVTMMLLPVRDDDVAILGLVMPFQGDIQDACHTTIGVPGCNQRHTTCWYEAARYALALQGSRHTDTTSEHNKLGST